MLEKAAALQSDMRSQEKYLALLGAMKDYEAEFNTPADVIARLITEGQGANDVTKELLALDKIAVAKETARKANQKGLFE